MKPPINSKTLYIGLICSTIIFSFFFTKPMMAGIKRLPEPLGHDPYNLATGEGFDIPGKLSGWKERSIRESYVISRIRPILPLLWKRDDLSQAFTLRREDRQGAEPELFEQTFHHWETLQGYGAALVRVVKSGDTIGGGIHIGGGRILTAWHVAEQVQDNSGCVIHWTGITTEKKESSASKIEWIDKPCDMAILKTDPPTGGGFIQPAMIDLKWKYWGNSEPYFLAVLGHPEKYGKIGGKEFTNIFGESYAARVCVGTFRPDIEPDEKNMICHDSYSEDRMSGSPVFDLQSGRLIGIHTQRHIKESVNMFSPLAGSSLSREVMSLP